AITGYHALDLAFTLSSAMPVKELYAVKLPLPNHDASLQFSIDTNKSIVYVKKGFLGIDGIVKNSYRFVYNQHLYPTIQKNKYYFSKHKQSLVFGAYTLQPNPCPTMKLPKPTTFFLLQKSKDSKEDKQVITQFSSTLSSFGLSATIVEQRLSPMTFVIEYSSKPAIYYHYRNTTAAVAACQLAASTEQVVALPTNAIHQEDLLFALPAEDEATLKALAKAMGSHLR
ncbi:MAG: hypothetical protein QW594_04375, partial [Candidatus Woesearchaeota archaeon]